MSLPGLEKIFEIIEENTQLKSLLQELSEWSGTPWDTPLGFAAGCKFCGKSFPQTYRDEEHYDNCIYQKIQKLLKPARIVEGANLYKEHLIRSMPLKTDQS